MDFAKITTTTEEEFVQGSVILLTSLINVAIQGKGACMLALSGGSTPKPVYEALGKSQEIDWSKVWVCLVDERMIAKSHEDSNQHLVRETLLKHAAIPEEHLLFPDTSLPIEVCVAEYAKALENVKSDLLILGMGEDGHIASLFPPVPKAAFDRSNHAIHTETEQFAVHDRISMTMPVLTRAASKFFLLRGEKKLKVWETMLASKEGKERWPAKEVLRSGGVTMVTGT